MKKIIFLLLALFPLNNLSFGSERPFPELVRLAKASKISPLLQARVSKLTGDFVIKVWVLFTDKNVFDGVAYRQSTDEAGNFFSRRARERRESRLQTDYSFDFYDLPVYEAYISELEICGFSPKRQSRWLNAASGHIAVAQLEIIAALPFVAEIRPVARFIRKGGPPGEGSTQDDSPQIIVSDYGLSYDQLQMSNIPALHDVGIDGTGVLIGFFDTGVRLEIPALGGLNLIAQRDFVDDDESVDAPESYEVDHGTKILSIIGGFSPTNIIGAAYNADFILARTERVGNPEIEIQAEEDNWVAAAEWADSIGADIITSSLGYYDWYDHEDLDGNTALITIAADLAVSRGIMVFCSAGNERSRDWGTITPPSDGDSVVAVGSVNIDNVIASSSSPGPTFDGRIKPDIVAKGVLNWCAYYSGGYGRVSGTSAAAPIAAGAAALILQANPDWSPIDVREAMKRSADRYLNPNNDYGWGLIDALDATDRIFIKPVSSQVVFIGDDLALIFSISGQEDSIPQFSALDLPPGATLIDNNDRTANLSYTATEADIGVWDILIIATAGEYVDTLAFTLTIAAEEKIVAIPNPFSDSLVVEFRGVAGQPNEVSIFTVTGEKVWNKFADNIEGTPPQLVWYGVNNENQRVAAGVYLILVRTGTATHRLKVLKIP